MFDICFKLMLMSVDYIHLAAAADAFSVEGAFCGGQKLSAGGIDTFFSFRRHSFIFRNQVFLPQKSPKRAHATRSHARIHTPSLIDTISAVRAKGDTEH